MKIDFKVTYNNGDTGAQDQQPICLQTDSDEIDKLSLLWKYGPTQQNLIALLRKTYNDPEIDGRKSELLYDN